MSPDLTSLSQHPIDRVSPQRPTSIDFGGVFPSAEVHASLMAMYDAKLAEWPVPYEGLDVSTRYGTAHVVAAGRDMSPPLILLHMAACTSFIWAPVIASLASVYRTYAVDIIGDVNKSMLADRAHRPRTGAELAEWLCEVSDALDVHRSDVVAASYGGWLGMHYATLAPARVRRLALLVPMGLPTWTQTLRVLFRLATIQVGLSSSKVEQTLAYLMGDDPAVRRLAGDWFTKIFTSKCRMNAPQPLPMKVSRLEALQMPTLVILGGRDQLIGDSERASRRAKRRIRDVEVEILPRGTHALLMEEPDRVVRHLLHLFNQ